MWLGNFQNADCGKLYNKLPFFNKDIAGDTNTHKEEILQVKRDLNNKRHINQLYVFKLIKFPI